MATRTNRVSVDVNVGSPRDGHVPIYDETIRLWTTKSTSSFFPNLTIDQISGSIFANRTYTFPQNLRISSSISSSNISASSAIIYNGYVTNVYSTNISSSIITASSIILTSITSSEVSASLVQSSTANFIIISSSLISSSVVSSSTINTTQAFVNNGYVTNTYATSISSSFITGSIGNISQVSSSDVSASNIINANSYSTNVYSSLISSSIVTGSNIFAETASLLMLGIGTRAPEYPLDVKNTRTYGIRAMLGPEATSSVTVWDGTYQANHPLRTKLPELDSSYFSISNKKPYGGVSDDEYYQFVNFLELADYTADDNETVYVMTNKSTYNSPYSHSAGITTFANLQDNLGGYVSSVYGNYNVLRTFGVGTVTNTSTGLLAWTTAENNARVNTGYGVYGLVQLQTNATIGNYYNFYGMTQLGTGGSITNLYGTYLSTAGNQSLSFISNYAGLVSSTGTVTASNNTLILLGTGTIPAGNYAIYNSSSYDNYFRGNVGIKTTRPSVALDINGDINISGSARRIYADFSTTSPISDRTMFQSNVSNGISNVYVIPNGTGGASTFTVGNNSNVDNSSIGQFIANATETSIRSNIVGSGTWLPFTIWTSGSERIKVDVLGNVGINQPNPAYKLDVNGNTNIVGDLIVGGLLTAISTSIQYVTSSQLLVGDNRIVVNTNENLRFGGISVNDSGSTSPTSGSLYWDSLRNHWLYENASGQSYNSAILISGPKNNGALGNETELTPNKLVYAVGTDHIGDAPAISNGTDIFIENNLSVSGSFRVKETGSFDGLLSASLVDISGLTTLRQVLEKATISTAATNGSINYDLLTQAVLYHTNNATGNWTLNFRGDGSTTLNSMMKVGQSLTSVFIMENGSTAYYPTSHLIDGVTVTPKWQHGEVPNAGIINATEVYSFNIIKLSDATFSILAARTPYYV